MRRAMPYSQKSSRYARSGLSVTAGGLTVIAQIGQLRERQKSSFAGAHIFMEKKECRRSA